MIAVVVPLKHGQHTVPVGLELYCHLLYRLGEIPFHLLLGDAAQGLIPCVHADILRLVESAEHAHLGEFRDSRQQHELQVVVRRLEYGVESPEHLPVPVLQRPALTAHLNRVVRIHHVQQRLVVFVDEHNAPPPGGFVGLAQDLRKAAAHVQVPCRSTVDFFPSHHRGLNLPVQNASFREVAGIEVNVKYRVLQPVLFQSIDGQSLEQLVPSEEVVLDRGYEQTLPEPSRTAQKIYFTALGQSVHQIRFVNIDVSVIAHLFETLNSYGKFHHGRILRIFLQK